jgi:hypothetical protein
MRFVDVADLPSLETTVLGPGRWHEVSQQQINQFADATGDHQCIHVDPERAASGPFGRSKWAQTKADAAAKMDELQARMDKRADQLDANMAASGAAWAEDAAAALDYASWTVDNARLAVLDAIDARAYADELAAKAAGS